MFIPWVEWKRTQSLDDLDGLLAKFVSAVEQDEAVWVESTEPDAPRKEIPNAEVLEGIELLRWHKRLAAGYPTMVMDMTFVYLCAAFDAYFQDYLVSFILACPHCIRSKKKEVTYETVLEHIEAGTLLNYLAQREAHELGYKSFSDQMKYLRDRLGVKLPPESVDLALLQRAIGIRNLIMHNDGYVNEVFLESGISPGDLSLGQRVQITPQYWKECKECFESLVLALGRDLLMRIYKLESTEVTKLLLTAVAQRSAAID